LAARAVLGEGLAVHDHDGVHFGRWILFIPAFISFIIFTISMFAETNRAPFDLPECETELVAGYHTEYSSMKFALFFLGEYAAMIIGSGLAVTLFLGGWSIPFGAAIEYYTTIPLSYHAGATPIWLGSCTSACFCSRWCFSSSSSSGCAGLCRASAMTSSCVWAG